MNEVNKTLYIPLYGKAQVSHKGIILNDPMAEKIWAEEAFQIKGKSKSKWLTYNMAMRARILDDWTDEMLTKHKDALVIHIGCGLDSRCLRVKQKYVKWFDCDFFEVIEIRRKYYSATPTYVMTPMDASDPEQVKKLPDHSEAIVILEGLSMYLTNDQLHNLLAILETKYENIHIMMDIYTIFGAKMSRYKNPINDVGVNQVYGIDEINDVIGDLKYELTAEHLMTPERLIKELRLDERIIFRILFKNKLYRKIYRLLELESTQI
ncbi:MAG: class I SAM-dependent methyltransferase [Erysipelotrichaceae bacterium]|nr:class I SAM-dependent methyltransferase [Erysipelotrichaceae bacterium]